MCWGREGYAAYAVGAEGCVLCVIGAGGVRFVPALHAGGCALFTGTRKRRALCARGSKGQLARVVGARGCTLCTGGREKRTLCWRSCDLCRYTHVGGCGRRPLCVGAARFVFCVLETVESMLSVVDGSSEGRAPRAVCFMPERL